jgi:hypothetical protein
LTRPMAEASTFLRRNGGRAKDGSRLRQEWVRRIAGGQRKAMPPCRRPTATSSGQPHSIALAGTARAAPSGARLDAAAGAGITARPTASAWTWLREPAGCRPLCWPGPTRDPRSCDPHQAPRLHSPRCRQSWGSSLGVA